jgi:hypothetical protein
MYFSPQSINEARRKIGGEAQENPSGYRKLITAVSGERVSQSVRENTEIQRIHIEAHQAGAQHSGGFH